MATITEMFSKAINEANKNILTVTDPYQKAMAQIALAQALATTGSVKDEAIATAKAETAAKAEAPKATEGKSALKNQPAKAKEAAPAKAEEAVAPAAAEIQEPELTEEWTEEAMTVLAAELEFVQVKQKEYTDEVLNDCVVQYSNGVLKEVSDLNPLTIKGFVAYIQQCESDAAGESQSA